jgi:hypothetical protein
MWAGAASGQGRKIGTRIGKMLEGFWRAGFIARLMMRIKEQATSM